MVRNIYCFLKYIYELLSELKENLFSRRIYHKFDNCSKNIFLITSPEYGNLGDHAIAESMIGYTKERFPDYKVHEISDSNFKHSIGWIINNNKEEDYIFLIGGGNFGVLYPQIEYWRRLVISKCKNAKIFLFPQSSVWRSDLCDKLQLNRSSKIYSKNTKLYLMAREKSTYDLMKKYFKNDTYITPDIVLTKKYIDSKCENDNHSNTVLLCFRNDVEKLIDKDIVETIEKIIVSKGYMIKKFDTETYKVIPYTQRKAVLDETMKMFLSCQCVITDRLHGMIFSAINGIPCLAFDSTTRKVSGVANEWLRSENIIVYNNRASLENQIKLLLEKKHFIFDQENIIKVFDNIFGKYSDI